MEHRAKLAGLALMFAALGAQALTLGRVRGAAVIGRPLDVVVQVQLDSRDSASSACFDAEVFHADARQDPRQVRVGVEFFGASAWSDVRIQSAALINEPVVTFNLRFGCDQKASRRYVLLADPASEPMQTIVPWVDRVPSPSPLPAVPDVPTGKSAISAALLAPAAPVTAGPVAAPSPRVRHRRGARRASVSVKVVRSLAEAAPREEVNKAVTPVAGQSRLKLDPLGQLSDRVSMLEPSSVASASEDVWQELQRIRALDAEVKALLALATKNDTNLADMKARLKKAESERFSATAVYSLTALVLVCLAALALLWRRQRGVQKNGEDWWKGSPLTQVPPPVELNLAPVGVRHVDVEPEKPVRKEDLVVPAPRFHDSVPNADVDVSLIELSESGFDKLMESASTQGAVRRRTPVQSPAASAQGAPHRSLNTETIMDIRQQAEFFVSLGQADQAVRVLERQIRESAAPNPLLYLDLLGVFHSLDLKADFRKARDDFNLLFNGWASEMAMFMDEGKNLDAYPDVLARITAHWGSARGIDLIETCIFRDPWEAKPTPFDLAAFRELLLLHEVALSAKQAPVMPPDLFQSAIFTSSVLDLDLSDHDEAPDSMEFESREQVDLPFCMPPDQVADSQEGDTVAPAEPVNLMHFDLPKSSGTSGSTGGMV